jgi:hypothetical protein
MSSDFVIWRYRSVKNAAVFTDLQGFDDTYLLHEATPLRADFPAEAAFHMNPDFPNDLLLPDNVGNSLQVNLVSESVHRFLEGLGLADVEYLPIGIVDHKGRMASRTHVIVNPVGPVDCIDMGQTTCTMSEFVEGDIDEVTRLVIDDSRVPAGRQIFKLKGLGAPTLVRRSLAAQIDQRGFSGFGWLEIDKYKT